MILTLVQIIIWVLVLNNSVILQWNRQFLIENWTKVWTFPISFKAYPAASVTHISNQGNDQTVKIINFGVTGINVGGNQQRMDVSIICIGY